MRGRRLSALPTNWTLLALALGATLAHGQPGTITTIAGNGSPTFGGDTGIATNAALNGATSIAIDGAGNLFIADAGNNRIRKITTANTITTIAGNGQASYAGDGGPATSAALNNPSGIALDAAGNLYIADQGNSRIRKITPGGIISTVAGGNGQAFSGDNGPATKAALYWPYGIALDTAGSLYIADTHNNRIRKVTPTGTITTIAGNGQPTYAGDGDAATSAALNSPTSVAIDAAGNVYIADQQNNRIRKVTTAGTITTIAGNGSTGSSGDGTTATNATLHWPNGITLDTANNVYIADSINNRIRKVTTAGIITTIAGTGTRGFAGDNGPATSALLNVPSSATITPTGDLYIADWGNNRIRKRAGGTAPQVLIVPGILGTKLVSDHGVAWLSVDEFFDHTGLFDLRYDTNHQPMVALRTADLLNLNANPTGTAGGSLDCQALKKVFADGVCAKVVNTYNPLVEALKGYGAQTFPYDWRRDIRDISDDLYLRIQSMQAAGGNVAIVAHSMGGLVVGEMLRRHPEVGSSLQSIITLGTPFGGSVDAFLNLEGWASLPIPGVTNQETLDIGKNWRSVYQLLPQWNFANTGAADQAFSASPTPQLLSYQDTYRGANDLFPALPAAAELSAFVYPLWDGATSFTKKYQNAYAIIGSGQATTTQVNRFNSALYGSCVSVTKGKGDGTVPIASAQRNTWNSKVWYVTEEHTGLPSNPQVLLAIQALLDGRQVSTLSDTPSAVRRTTVVQTCDVPNAGSGGANTTAQSIASRESRSASTNAAGQPTALSLTVRDQSGAVVSSNAMQIDGAEYLQLPTGAAITLPEGHYTVELNGAAPGRSTILIQTLGTDTTIEDQKAFVNLSVTPQSHGTLALNNASVQALQYDQNGSGSMQTITPATWTSGLSPQFAAAGVMNAASFAQGGLSPGAIVSIFGTNLTSANGVITPNSPILPTQLGGTRVAINGIMAPLFAVASTNGQDQINLQAPYEIAGQNTASIVVTNNGTSSTPITVPVLTSQPGIFTSDGTTGIIVHGATNQLVTAASPAKPGEVIVIYATGLGPVSPTPPTGAPAGASPLSAMPVMPSVSIGGQNATVQWAGLTPGFAGLYQINAVVPSVVASGNLAVIVTASAQASKPATMAVTLTSMSSIDLGSGTKMGFVPLPSGEFVMGCSTGDTLCSTDERPAHSVRITKSLQMGQYEVAQTQWQAVMGNNPSGLKSADRPVENVKFDDILQFLQRLSARNDEYTYRLPTEAEWEYAARAGTTGAYYGDLDSIGWYRDNADRGEHPVGQKQPNAWGLYDMIGNLCEWTQDYYSPTYYSSSPTSDPPGPSAGTNRAARGGSWYDLADKVRVSSRTNYSNSGGAIFGFRVVRELQNTGIPAGTITTVAGTGVAGYSDDGGNPTAAALSSPYGVSIDSSGNVLIADTRNYRIRKLANGTITTIAGIGTPGITGDGGPAVSAQLKLPYSVAADSSGNIYIADTNNVEVRKVTTNGIINTIAGTGFMGGYSGDGPATSTKVVPNSVVVDPQANVYIADGNRIRKLTNGTITTIAGDTSSGSGGDGGLATAAQLSLPRGVAVDSVGTVYIADTGNHRIRKIVNGIITTVAGIGTPGSTGDGNAATSAALNGPQGLAIDNAGTIYVADTGNHRIRRISNGTITTVAGTGTAGSAGDGGPADSAQLRSPYAVAVDTRGNLYIADAGNNLIRKVSGPSQ